MNKYFFKKVLDFCCYCGIINSVKGITNEIETPRKKIKKNRKRCLTFSTFFAIIILTKEKELSKMTIESMRKLKAEIHKELVDFIFENTDTDDEMDELWQYVIELAQKELEYGNK